MRITETLRLDSGLVNVAISHSFEPGEFVHLQLAGSPVFHVAVWGDEPKHFDPAVALEMGARAALGDVCVTQRAVAFSIRVL